MQVAAAVLLVLVLATLSAAWLPGAPGAAAPTGLVEGPWQAEGCAPGPGPDASPALTALRVLAVVLGLAAALKLPLMLAKLLLAKVLVLLPLAIPLALPLLAPFLLVAALLPMTGMEDAPEAPATPSAPVTPVVPALPSAAPGNGASAEQEQARAAWIESCVQRVACHLSKHRSGQDCVRYRCAAVDWISTS